MPTMNEMFENLGKAVNELKETNDAALELKADKESVDVLITEKADRINEAITKMKDEISDVKKALSRTKQATEKFESMSDEQKTHLEVFTKYIKSGGKDTEGLAKAQKDVYTKTDLDTVTGSHGEFLVPQVIDSVLGRRELEIGSLHSDARNQPVSTPQFEIAWNLRGLVSGWVGETDARTKTGSPTFAKIDGVFGEVYAFPFATYYSLRDPLFDLEQLLVTDTEEEFMLQEAQAFVTGNGTKKPLGFLSATSALTDDATRTFGEYQQVLTGEPGGFLAPTASVSPGDVFYELVHKFKAVYRPNLKWRMNKTTAGVVRTFKDVDGRYIWQDSMQLDMPDRLLGYPVALDEAMPDIGLGNEPIALGDWMKAYRYHPIPGTSIAVRDNITDLTGVGFYMTRRIGGEPVDTEAYKTISTSTS